jgi:hypothetical protein
MRRRFVNFKNDPIGRIKYLRWKLITFWGRYQLSRNGNLNVLTEFVSARPEGAFPPDFSDLWFLYKQVRKRRPRTILEFGTGCSTVILAKALFDNEKDSQKHGGFLYSVDADPNWTESTSQAIPVFLKRFCEIWYSPVVEVEYNGTPAFRHSRLPDIAPNFAYLDGPPLTAERQVAVDILEIEDRLPSDFFLVIDDRKENTRYLLKNLKRRYRFRERRIFGAPIFILLG